MIDNIIFTKDKTVKLPQLEFEMPVGYKLYTPNNILVGTNFPSEIDFGVDIFSIEKPLTIIFTLSIQSKDIKIVNPIQMIAPKVSTRLKIGVINPNLKEVIWELSEGSLIATIIILESYAVNLLEVNNNLYKEYV